MLALLGSKLLHLIKNISGGLLNADDLKRSLILGIETLTG